MPLDPNGHPTSPRGFRAALHTCGIKVSGSPDLALLVSDRPSRWDAVFTTNAVAAAPVVFGRERLAQGLPLRAILVNSGNANAVTGERGLADARETAALLERSLDLPEGSALVSSTGVIGVPLPMDKIRRGVPGIAPLPVPDGGAAFARGIMTTDTRPKHASISFPHAGGEITLGGCAKGAGMIHPRMATMLSYLTCDADIHPDVLGPAFRRCVESSYNRISVDGDTSTNDTCVLLANGGADLPAVLPGTSGASAFEEALRVLTAHLSREIVRDGEGATTVVRLDVVGARDALQAELVARAVCNSPLVKTAIHGRGGRRHPALGGSFHPGGAGPGARHSLRLRRPGAVRGHARRGGPDPVGPGPGEGNHHVLDLRFLRPVHSDKRGLHHMNQPTPRPPYQGGSPGSNRRDRKA